MIDAHLFGFSTLRSGAVSMTLHIQFAEAQRVVESLHSLHHHQVQVRLTDVGG